MHRRLALVAFVCLVALAAGCGPVKQDSRAPVGSVPTVSQGKPVALSGKGNGEYPVQVPFGLVVFGMQHPGEGPFRVELRNAQSQSLTMISGDGAVAGSRAWSAAGGTYTVVVSSDNDWSIGISQPATSSAEPTTSITGFGPKASGLFKLKAGQAKFTFVGSGKGQVLVELLDNEGVTAATIAKGAVAKNEQTVTVKPGNYLLNVIDTGQWTVGVAQP